MKVRELDTQRGFTLMEIFAALAIVSILFLTVIPTYQKQIIKSKRADAKISLTKWSQAMERYYTENNRYYTGSTTGFLFSVSSDEDHYSMVYGTRTNTTFTLLAVPLTITDDEECQTLSLNHLGVKGVQANPTTGTPAPTLTTTSCW